MKLVMVLLFRLGGSLTCRPLSASLLTVVSIRSGRLDSDVYVELSFMVHLWVLNVARIVLVLMQSIDMSKTRGRLLGLFLRTRMLDNLLRNWWWTAVTRSLVILPVCGVVVIYCRLVSLVAIVVGMPLKLEWGVRLAWVMIIEVFVGVF